MNVITFIDAQTSLNTVMDDVCKDHKPILITRADGEHVVMLSLTDFNSMEETLYLLSSPKNTNRLMESVAQLKAGQVHTKELIRHEQVGGQEQDS